MLISNDFGFMVSLLLVDIVALILNLTSAGFTCSFLFFVSGCSCEILID